MKERSQLGTLVLMSKVIYELIVIVVIACRLSRYEDWLLVVLIPWVHVFSNLTVVNYRFEFVFEILAKVLEMTLIVPLWFNVYLLASAHSSDVLNTSNFLKFQLIFCTVLSGIIQLIFLIFSLFQSFHIEYIVAFLLMFGTDVLVMLVLFKHDLIKNIPSISAVLPFEVELEKVKKNKSNDDINNNYLLQPQMPYFYPPQQAILVPSNNDDITQPATLAKASKH